MAVAVGSVQAVRVVVAYGIVHFSVVVLILRLVLVLVELVLVL